MSSTSPTPRTTASSVFDSNLRLQVRLRAPTARPPASSTRSTAWRSARAGSPVRRRGRLHDRRRRRVQKFTLDGTLARHLRRRHAVQPRMAEVNPVTRDLYVVNARDRQVVVSPATASSGSASATGHRAAASSWATPAGSPSAADGTRVFVTDDGNHRVQVFNGAGRFKLLPSNGAPASTGTHSSTRAGSRSPADGSLVVADEWDFALKEYARRPTAATFAQALRRRAAAGRGQHPSWPRRRRPRPASSSSDWWNQRIQRWNSRRHATSSRWGSAARPTEPGSINFAWDVAVQPATGRVFVANRESHEIEVFTARRRLRHPVGHPRHGDRAARVPAGRRLRPPTARCRRRLRQRADPAVHHRSRARARSSPVLRRTRAPVPGSSTCRPASTSRPTARLGRRHATTGSSGG